MAISMGAALLGSAIIGGGASVLASNNNSKAISKGTDAQLTASREQQAFQREIYGKNEGYLSPSIARGDAAGNAINALLGLGGSAVANDAYNVFRQSTGYQDRLQEGYRAVNANYAANGILQSGAAQKALLKYGQTQASNEFGNYLSYLGNQQGVGLSGASALAGVGQSYANNMGQIAQNNANALGQAAVARANNSNALLGSIGNIAGQTAGALSSYGSSSNYARLVPSVSSVMSSNPAIF